MNKTKFVFCGVVSGLLLSAVPGAAQADGTDKLKPHRAVYDLTLGKSSERSGITGMEGRIVYEITGSKCDGYSVRFRFLTSVQTSRKSFTNDQRTTSFETGDGNSFSFVNQSYLNGQLEKELRGKAERAGTGLKVNISQPEELEGELEDAIFMTQHIGRIIEAGRKGETIISANVYDGSDDGESVFETTAIIGKAKADTTKIEGEAEEISKLFKDSQAWPVSVSYFKKDDTKGEKLPIYQVSFLLHESGVSRQLKMQYDDYSLVGNMTGIEFLKETKCE